jgi:hypothetical protein
MKNKILYGVALSVVLVFGMFGVAGAEEVTASTRNNTTNAAQTQDQGSANSQKSDSGSKPDSVPVTEVEVTETIVKDSKDKEQEKKKDGEREPAYSNLAIPESTCAVETFTAEDIEAIRPNDVCDVIEFAMGMDIQRQGARIHTFTYGRGGNNIPIIIDGVYITNDSAKRVLGDLPVSMIQSVKIVRDSTVLTLAPLGGFGSTSGGASGQGAIIITTKKAVAHETEASMGYSGYNTQKLSVSSGMEFKNQFNVGVGYAKSKSDGRDGWNNGYDFDALLLNGRYTDESLIVNTSLFLNKGWREIQRAFDSHAAKGGYNTTNIAMWKYDPMDTMVYTLNVAKPWNATNVTAFSFGHSQVEGTQYAYTYNGVTDVFNTSVTGRAMEDRADEINLSHTITLGRNTLKFGSQIIGSDQLGEGAVRSSAQKDEIYGYYITDENRINEKLTVDGGFRLDKRHITRGGEKYQSDGGIAEIADDKWTDDTYGLAIGAVCQLNAVYSLLPRFSYNHTPTPEMWTTANDEELPAEERYKYEVGVTAEYSKTFNIAVTAFYYNIKNGKKASGIITVPDEDGEEQNVSVYSPVTTMRRSGLEISFDGQLIGAFGYKVGYTYYTSSSASEDSKFPDNKYSLQLNYKKNSFNASIATMWVDPYLSNSYEVGNFNVVNINIGKTLNKSTKISVFGRNVTDEHYATNYKGTPQEWGYLYDVGAVYGIELIKKF